MTLRQQIEAAEYRLSRPSEPDSVCWHEAGHAVMAALLGVLVVSASVKRDGGWAGAVAHYGHREPIETRLRISLAGPVAENLAAGRSGELPECLTSASEDDFQASKLIRQHRYLSLTNAEARRDPLYADALADTISRLRANWQKVRAVAQALNARQTLDATEILRLTE